MNFNWLISWTQLGALRSGFVLGAILVSLSACSGVDFSSISSNSGNKLGTADGDCEANECATTDTDEGIDAYADDDDDQVAQDEKGDDDLVGDPGDDEGDDDLVGDPGDDDGDPTDPVPPPPPGLARCQKDFNTVLPEVVARLSLAVAPAALAPTSDFEIVVIDTLTKAITRVDATHRYNKPNKPLKFDERSQILKKVIKAAGDDAVILVGKGPWVKHRAQVKKQHRLELYGNCEAQVRGFKLYKSSDIIIDGFIVRPFKHHNYNGIYINKKNDTIQIVNNDIGGFGSFKNSKNGIHVKKDKNIHILIKDNVISRNSRNGIKIYGKHNSDIMIEHNTIVLNGRNGIEIKKGATQIVIKDSLIARNGQHKNHAMENGYGVKRSKGNPKKLDPKDVTLLDSVIAENNGKVKQKPESDQNFYNKPALLDATDTGNSFELTDALKNELASY